MFIDRVIEGDEDEDEEKEDEEKERRMFLMDEIDCWIFAMSRVFLLRVCVFVFVALLRCLSFVQEPQMRMLAVC